MISDEEELKAWSELAYEWCAKPHEYIQMTKEEYESICLASNMIPYEDPRVSVDESGIVCMDRRKNR